MNYFFPSVSKFGNRKSSASGNKMVLNLSFEGKKEKKKPVAILYCPLF